MKRVTKLVLVGGIAAIVGVGGLVALKADQARRHHHAGMYDDVERGSHWGRHHRGHHRYGAFRGKRFKHLKERFDTNKDGKLTQEEIDKARENLLAKHDSDKDGELTLAEFKTLWLEVMNRRMVRGFQRIDENGDAKITLGEFLKPFSDIVARRDRNGDGVLDSQDRRHKWGHWRRKKDDE